ncbi:MAG: type II secretion system protein [Synergistaceae bacterium]|nr:type II secretion system protein [Synergistaceae bacterium]
MIPKHARRGFTLVELLIVIVVIRILSAMMMLSSTEAVTTAKVSNIISNMRQLKTATLEWYTDHIDYIHPSDNDQIANYKMTYTDDNGNSSTGNAKTITNVARNDPTEITRYLSNGGSVSLCEKKSGSARTNNMNDLKEGSYMILDGTVMHPAALRTRWFVGYSVPNDKRIKQKIAGRAKSLGLISGWDNTTNSGKIYDSTTNDGKFVYLEILNLGDSQ